METTPEQIIECFDYCLIYVFGQKYARENPHVGDMDTARSWIDAGANIFLAAYVFFDRMNSMHEKFSHQSFENKDRSNIPGVLKLFDQNILAAIRKSQGDEVTQFEAEMSRWRARVIWFVKKPGAWREEMWGPAPDQPGTRVPQSILRESALLRNYVRNKAKANKAA